MALDAGGDDLDTSRDTIVADRPVFPRRNAEHDDAWRSRARGRHSRRRLHGDDREYASPVDRRTHAAGEGHASRRGRNRRADACFHARDKLRVHVGGISRRPGQIFVHAARARGGVRDAGILRLVAYADADHDRAVAAGRKTSRAGYRRAGPVHPHFDGVRTFLRTVAGGVSQAVDDPPASAGDRAGRACWSYLSWAVP